MPKFIGIFLICLFFCSVSYARPLVRIIDGDSLKIGEKEIRLEGIDAPEYKQYCYDAHEKSYPCGKRSFQFLKKLASKGNIHCRQISKDRYHRQVSICFSGTLDINKEMVRQGWAIAYTRYTKAYQDDEKEAKKHKRGLWQGRFMKPEFYRILQKARQNHQ